MLPPEESLQDTKKLEEFYISSNSDPLCNGDAIDNHFKNIQCVLATIKNEGLTQYYGLRKVWSTFILLWISSLIGFNMLLTIAVGEGNLNFKNYQWFVTTVTTETFLQIVGLGFVAARYLFSSKHIQ